MRINTVTIAPASENPIAVAKINIAFIAEINPTHSDNLIGKNVYRLIECPQLTTLPVQFTDFDNNNIKTKGSFITEIEADNSVLTTTFHLTD